MSRPIVKPVRVEPPLGDRVVWTRRIVDAAGQPLGMISAAPDAFLALMLEAVNDFLYDPEVAEDLDTEDLAAEDIEAGERGLPLFTPLRIVRDRPAGGWLEAVEA